MSAEDYIDFDSIDAYDSAWAGEDADRRQEERDRTAYMNVDASDEYDVDPLEWVPAEMASLTEQLSGLHGMPAWPPSEEWTRRLRSVLAEVEGAQRSARGDDPPDSGQSLGLEVRSGR